MYIAENDSATFRPRLISNFEFELQVGVRLDLLSVFEVDKYLEFGIAEYQRNLDIRYESDTIEKRDKNRLDLIPLLCKINFLSYVEFVHQPIFRAEILSNKYFLTLVDKTFANCTIVTLN